MLAAQLHDIPAGDEGLKVKLRTLRDLVERAKADPEFRRAALSLVGGVKGKDYDGEIAAVSQFLRTRLRYTRDPYGVELFQDPRLLAQQIQRGELAAGDCDDFAGLGAALLETLGHPTRFRVGGWGALRGAERDHGWAHIWLDVRHPRRGWIPLDDTAQSKPRGWDPSQRFPVTTTERAAPPRTTMHDLTHSGGRYGGTVSLLELPEYLGGYGLGGFGKKWKKKLKKVGGKITRSALTGGLSLVSKKLDKKVRKVGRKVEKPLKKALPVLAIAANVIPGVGTAVSAGLAVAAYGVKKRAENKALSKQKDQMRAAEAQYAAEEAAFLAQQQQQAAEPAPAPMFAPQVDYGYQQAEPVPEAYPPQAYDPYSKSFADWAQWVGPYYGPQPEPTGYGPTADYAAQWGPQVQYSDPYASAWAEQWGRQGLGFDWGGLLTNVTQALPSVVGLAQSGAFGKRLAKNVGRISGQVSSLAPRLLPQGPAVQQMPRPAPPPGQFQGPLFNAPPPPRVLQMPPPGFFAAQSSGGGRKGFEVSPGMLAVAGAGVLAVALLAGRRR